MSAWPAVTHYNHCINLLWGITSYVQASTHQGVSSQDTAWYTSNSETISACLASMLSKATCPPDDVCGPSFLIHWGTV